MPDEPVEPTPADPIPRPLLVPAERVAWMLSISKSSLWKLHAVEKIPAPVRLGGRTLWSLVEIEGWVAAGCPSRERWETLRAGAAEKGGKSRGRST